MEAPRRDRGPCARSLRDPVLYRHELAELKATIVDVHKKAVERLGSIAVWQGLADGLRVPRPCAGIEPATTRLRVVRSSN